MFPDIQLMLIQLMYHCCTMQGSNGGISSKRFAKHFPVLQNGSVHPDCVHRGPLHIPCLVLLSSDSFMTGCRAALVATA